MIVTMYAIIASILGTFGTGFAGYITYKLKARDQDAKGSRLALQFLLRVQLRQYHTEAHRVGYINYDDLEDFLALHGAYKSLGGNGVGDRMAADIQQLALRTGNRDTQSLARSVDIERNGLND